MAAALLLLLLQGAEGAQSRAAAGGLRGEGAGACHDHQGVVVGAAGGHLWHRTAQLQPPRLVIRRV